MTLFVSSQLEKQRAEVDGRAADELYRMEESEMLSSIDLWLFVTPFKKPAQPGVEEPEFFYSQEDDFEMITKNRELMSAAYILDFKDGAVMANLCCNPESLSLMENLEKNPLIQIATFPSDVNAPTKIVYKRQKHVTVAPDDSADAEDTYEEDEHIFDTKEGKSKDPKKIVIYKPTARKQFKVVDETKVSFFVLADRLFDPVYKPIDASQFNGETMSTVECVFLARALAIFQELEEYNAE